MALSTLAGMIIFDMEVVKKKPHVIWRMVEK